MIDKDLLENYGMDRCTVCGAMCKDPKQPHNWGGLATSNRIHWPGLRKLMEETMTEDNWQHRSQGMRCKTCVYFVPKIPLPSPVSHEEIKEEQYNKINPVRYDLGRCRRHAPTLNGWPAVFVNDWCGDHKLDENKI